MVYAGIREASCVLDQRADSDSHTGVGMLSLKQRDLAIIRYEMTADQLHCSGLSASVFSDESVDRTQRNGHVEVIYRIHPTKAFGKISDFNSVH